MDDAYSLSLHPASDQKALLYLLFGVLGFAAFASFVRCLRMDRWMRGPPDSCETVSGIVTSNYGWSMSRDFRVAFTTLSNLRIKDSVDFGVPILGELGFQKGDSVDITYCATNARLFYITSWYKGTRRAILRGLIFNPLGLFISIMAVLFLIFVV